MGQRTANMKKIKMIKLCLEKLWNFRITICQKKWRYKNHNNILNKKKWKYKNDNYFQQIKDKEKKLKIN